MSPTKSISIFFISLYIVLIAFYASLYYYNSPKSAMISVALLAPLVTIFYFVSISKRNIFFSLFLITCSISNIYLLWSLGPTIFKDTIFSDITSYYISNSFLVLSYLFLTIKICLDMDFAIVWKKFKLHIFVLASLGFYVVYVLVISVIVADTLMYVFEIVYDTSLVVLFSLSLIHYFYFEDKKSFFLFLGLMLIVFQEVLGIVYAYLNREIFYALIWITLSTASYYFLLLQTKMEHKKQTSFLDEPNF